MRNLLIFFLLGTITLFAQKTPKINGAFLSYNKKNNKMILTISDKTVDYPDNSGYDTRIRIMRKPDLIIKINRTEYSVSEQYFITYGYKHPKDWFFITEYTGGNGMCIKRNGFDYGQKFSNIEKGTYILIIDKRCDKNYIEETWKTSLIVK